MGKYCVHDDEDCGCVAAQHGKQNADIQEALSILCDQTALLVSELRPRENPAATGFVEEFRSFPTVNADPDMVRVSMPKREWQRMLSLQSKLDAAYAELRKLRPSIGAIFDRRVWDAAEAWATKLPAQPAESATSVLTDWLEDRIAENIGAESVFSNGDFPGDAAALQQVRATRAAYAIVLAKVITMRNKE